MSMVDWDKRSAGKNLDAKIDQPFERLFSTILSSGLMSNNLDVRARYDLVRSYD